MTRPSKFTPETVETLLNAIGRGLPFHLAAQAAGVAETTFYAWQAGKFPRNADKELKAGFSEALTRARGLSALQLIETISDASAEDWRAAAWILERRFPEDFGKTRVEVTGANGGPVQVEVAALQRVILSALRDHPEARIEVAQALKAASGGR